MIVQASTAEVQPEEERPWDYEVGSGTVYKHHNLTHNIDKLAVQQDEMLKLCENHVKNNLFYNILLFVVLATVVNK